MTVPEPGDTDRSAKDANNAPGWQLLAVQPFPCLVAEANSGRVLFVNAAAHEALLGPGPGYATDAAGGRIDKADLPRQLTASAGPEGTEITWHGSERQRTYRVFCRTLPSGAGSSARAVLTFVDVTAQKAAEESLRQALEARDEFFSVATHELKDPLFSLQLAIQLLRRLAQKQAQVPADFLRHLEVSERQAQRLAGLIDNLLDVSRIMNHRVHLDVEAVDLAGLAREAVGRFQARADAAGTALTAEAGAPVICYGDRIKLEQVLGNLITNAIKYGAGKPVAVRVRGEDGVAVVEVEDRGVGIAPEDQARIFHRFERASEGHRRDSLGLGLYIVRALVEAHGGSISLRSQPGRGTTFTVKLPRTRLNGTGNTEQEPTGR
ncbi:MAG TPA: HAMP domain-containing sensor histidine kinase [Gemmataceae bacterium]|nr:HAMP domain-containing sensor histidine kinase [Gemmataceae bacterium]